MKPKVICMGTSQGGVFFVHTRSRRKLRKILGAIQSVEVVAMVTDDLPVGTMVPVGCTHAFLVLGDLLRQRDTGARNDSEFTSLVVERTMGTLRDLLGEKSVREIRLLNRREQ